MEVLREAHRCGMDSDDLWAEPGTTPVDRLERFIRHFLGRVLSMNRTQDWQHRLMLREIISPTAFSEVLVRETIRPRFEHLRSLLREICPEADDRRLHVLVFSVIGQCLYYKVGRRMAERLIGEEGLRELDADYLSAHIASFCLAALGQGPPLGPSGKPSDSTFVTRSRS